MRSSRPFLALVEVFVLLHALPALASSASIANCTTRNFLLKGLLSAKVTPPELTNKESSQDDLAAGSAAAAANSRFGKKSAESAVVAAHGESLQWRKLQSKTNATTPVNLVELKVTSRTPDAFDSATTLDATSNFLARAFYSRYKRGSARTGDNILEEIKTLFSNHEFDNSFYDETMSNTTLVNSGEVITFPVRDGDNGYADGGNDNPPEKRNVPEAQPQEHILSETLMTALTEELAKHDSTESQGLSTLKKTLRSNLAPGKYFPALVVMVPYLTPNQSSTSPLEVPISTTESISTSLSSKAELRTTTWAQPSEPPDAMLLLDQLPTYLSQQKEPAEPEPKEGGQGHNNKIQPPTKIFPNCPFAQEATHALKGVGNSLLRKAYLEQVHRIERSREILQTKPLPDFFVPTNLFNDAWANDADRAELCKCDHCRDLIKALEEKQRAELALLMRKFQRYTEKLLISQRRERKFVVDSLVGAECHLEVEPEPPRMPGAVTLSPPLAMATGLPQQGLQNPDIPSTESPMLWTPFPHQSLLELIANMSRKEGDSKLALPRKNNRPSVVKFKLTDNQLMPPASKPRLNAENQTVNPDVTMMYVLGTETAEVTLPAKEISRQLPQTSILERKQDEARKSSGSRKADDDDPPHKPPLSSPAAAAEHHSNDIMMPPAPPTENSKSPPDDPLSPLPNPPPPPMPDPGKKKKKRRKSGGTKRNKESKRTKRDIGQNGTQELKTDPPLTTTKGEGKTFQFPLHALFNNSSVGRDSKIIRRS